MNHISKTVRFPKVIYNQLMSYVKSRDSDFSKEVIKACERYIKSQTPGLCKNCQSIIGNKTDFCPMCGFPASSKAYLTVMEYHRGIVLQNDIEMQRHMEKRIRGIIRHEIRSALKEIMEMHGKFLFMNEFFDSSPVSPEPSPERCNPPVQDSDGKEEDEEIHR